MKRVLICYPSSSVFHFKTGVVVATMPTGYSEKDSDTWYLVKFDDLTLKPYSFMKKHLREL